MRRLLVSAIALALAGASLDAAAQAAAPNAAPPVVDATTQLPRNVRPIHYTIAVVPHADKMTFDGTVSIAVDVLEPTDKIVLNAVDMTFSKAVLNPQNGKVQNAKVSLDAKNQTATFTFASKLNPG